jgi:hypothetical protein
MRKPKPLSRLSERALAGLFADAAEALDACSCGRPSSITYAPPGEGSRRLCGRCFEAEIKARRAAAREARKNAKCTCVVKSRPSHDCPAHGDGGPTVCPCDACELRRWVGRPMAIGGPVDLAAVEAEVAARDAVLTDLARAEARCKGES